MYPVRYKQVRETFYILDIPREPHWYKWSVRDAQAELLVSKKDITRLGRHKCTFTWDRERLMLSIEFSECYLSYKELNEDVLAAVVADNGEKLLQTKRTYLVESSHSAYCHHNKLIFIFNEIEWKVARLVNWGKDFNTFACFIPDFDESILTIKSVKEEKEDPLPSPALDLSNLLESSKFSDVTIITTNEDGERHEFSAHWNILASRSDVFLKMFETDMKEKTEGRIEIKEFKTEVMQQVLAYIYAGKIDVDAVSPVASDILRAADYYNLDPLRQTIGQILEEKLARDNAFEYLVLGDMYKVPRLKKAAIKFIITEIDNMTENQGFKFISDSHVHLMMDLLVAVTKK